MRWITYGDFRVQLDEVSRSPARFKVKTALSKGNAPDDPLTQDLNAAASTSHCS